jgi:hypothetical protein
MNSVKNIFVIAILSLAIGACASKQDKKLTAKVSEEKSIQSNAELTSQANDTIKNSPNLNDEQKSKLMALRAEMTTQSNALRDESFKLRSVLIKDLISKDEHVNEVKLIKARLRKIEDQRLDVLFGAIDQANIILGKYAAEHQKMLEQTLRDDRAMSRGEN